ncbi:MAG: hypothetical protein M1823_002334 [Watsoniomyces obsoletus]|nr:MAG: hypothetical protein M1823_002334 [Watsoniomyces obsoletus]
MAPPSNKAKKKTREQHQSRSRNTTPSSAGTGLVTGNLHAPAATTALVDTLLAQIMIPTQGTYDEILERHGSQSGIPDAKQLDTMATDLRRLAQSAENRSKACDRGIRELAKRRKEVMEQQLQKEREDRELAERTEQLKKEAAAKSAEELIRERKTPKARRRRESAVPREERPLAHGAHELAPQDGSSKKTAETALSEPSKASIEPEMMQLDVKQETTSTSMSSFSPPSQVPTPTALPDITVPQKLDTIDSAADSPMEEEHQPPPAQPIQTYQTFGPDPTTFDDPTIYHIREVTPGMTEDEIKEIYSVAEYPHDDLHDLTPGTPPDGDLSNAKPPNQVNASTFTTYVDPYFRPLTDEDLAFLRERGDRVQPFLIPPRGKRHYSEVWADEDGAVSADNVHQAKKRLPANQPRGTVEQMNDETAESDQVSAGPMLSRLLAALRPEHRPIPIEEKAVVANGLPNGEATTNNSLPNRDVVMADVNVNGDIPEENQVNGGGDAEKPAPIPPATFIPDSTQPGWKVATTKLEYMQVDERVKQELRYLGFLSEDAEPDYDAHYDDEIAARLRLLQAELKEQSIINGARKARLCELAKDRLSFQEYMTIVEDLDNQVQGAYLRRTKTLLAKPKKPTKRPGGAGGGSHYVGGAGGQGGAAAQAGVPRPGIGDQAKTLMDRRKKWMNALTPIFENDMVSEIPKESIFETGLMGELMAKEREGWEEVDE